MKQNFEIELLPEAVEFLENLDVKSREKVFYNIKKAQFTNSNEFFKKLNEFIWKFRTLFNSKSYRLFYILGQNWRTRNDCNYNPRNIKKDAENTAKRNQESRRN